MYKSKTTHQFNNSKVVVYTYEFISFIHIYGTLMNRSIVLLDKAQQSYEQCYINGVLRYIKVKVTDSTPSQIASLPPTTPQQLPPVEDIPNPQESLQF